MKKIVIATAFAVSQLLAVSAFAQTTRAEVKAEAASANKSGAIGKGEVTQPAKAKSTAPRAEVKKEAAAAEKAGTIPAGEAGSKDPKAKSEKARAEVKAETKDAVKKGEIAKGDVPAGAASAAKK